MKTIHVLRLRGGERPAAGLITPGNETRAALLLRVRAETTFVGRGVAAKGVEERQALTGVVEAAQWKITCTRSEAKIEDAGSTSGSVLVRRADRETVPLTLTALVHDPR